MKKIITYFKRLYLKLLYINRNKKRKSVFFYSFGGQYSDSPRAISEAIHKLDSSIELAWRVNDGVITPDYVKRYCSRFDAKKAQVQADAWVLINNIAPSLGDFKGKDTFYVLTWHGDRLFKRIGWATQEELGEKFDDSYFDPSNIDLFTSASDCGDMIAHEGLHYDGEIQKVGIPRNDKLVNPDYYLNDAIDIKKKIGISLKSKVLLFAPTFRDKQATKQKVTVDILKIVDLLNNKGEDWVCLVRAHSSSKGLDFGQNEQIIDVTKYSDMSDLLLITDLLITDYSSCAGDFILTDRPCILAQFDRDEYENSSRKLWINPDETGFLIAKNQDELEEIVSNLYNYNHKEIAWSIRKFYGIVETGESSLITAKRIINWINSHHQ